MLSKSFTVFHKNPEARIALGRGFVVGQLANVTSYQYQSSINRGAKTEEFPNGTPITCLVTENKTILNCQVLWENARDVSPSLHLSTDLEWEEIVQDTIETSGDDVMEVASNVLATAFNEGIISETQLNVLTEQFELHTNEDEDETEADGDAVGTELSTGVDTNAMSLASEGAELSMTEQGISFDHVGNEVSN